MPLYYSPVLPYFVGVTDLFMNAFVFGILNGWEILLIVAVVLLLFGAKKLPELARSAGQGIREFKKATRRNAEQK